MAKSGRKGAERPIFDFQGSLKISGYLGHEFFAEKIKYCNYYYPNLFHIEHKTH